MNRLFFNVYFSVKLKSSLLFNFVFEKQNTADMKKIDTIALIYRTFSLFALIILFGTISLAQVWEEPANDIINMPASTSFDIDLRFVVDPNMGDMPDIRLSLVSGGPIDIKGKEIENMVTCMNLGNDFDQLDLTNMFCNAGSPDSLDLATLNFNPIDSVGSYTLILEAVYSQNGNEITAPPKFVTLNINASTVPTLSQWGIVLFILMILTLGLVTMYNVNLVTVQSNGVIAKTKFQIPFDWDLMKKAFPQAIAFGLLGLTIVLIGWGEIILDDIIGLSLSVILLTYLIHILFQFKGK